MTETSAHLAVEAAIQAASRNLHHESHDFVTEVTKVSIHCLHVCWFETTTQKFAVPLGGVIVKMALRLQ